MFLFYYSVGLKGDNLYEWNFMIFGFFGFVYDGGVFYFDIFFLMDYFFKLFKVCE